MFNSEVLIRRLAIMGFLFSILLGEVTTLDIAGRTPSLLYADIYLLVLSYWYVVRFFIRGKAIVGDKPVLILCLLYIFANIVSIMINGSDLFKGILSIKTFVNGFIIYFVVLSLCREERDVDWAIYSLVFFTTVLSLILISKFLIGFEPLEKLTKEMIEIGWGKSNYLASFIALFIPVSFGIVFSARRLMIRLVFIGCCTLMFFALAITMSKGAMLSLAIVLGIVLPLILRIRAKVKYIVILTAVVGCLFYLLTKFMPQFIVDTNIALIEHRVFNPDYTRLQLMWTSWDDFLQNPLFGIGPYETKMLPSKYDIMPHNFVLQVLAELGLFGGIPFMLIISLFLFRAYRNCSYGCIENFFMFAGVIGTLLHGLSELTFQGIQYMTVFWIFMAVIYLRYRALILKDQAKIIGFQRLDPKSILLGRSVHRVYKDVS